MRRQRLAILILFLLTVSSWLLTPKVASQTPAQSSPTEPATQTPKSAPPESQPQAPPDVKQEFPLSANISTPIDPNAFRLMSNVDVVLLDVSVKDTRGGFASGLTKEQFHVFDNGKEQDIQYFEAGDIPVTLGLVVDNSGSMRPKRPDVVTAALAFVQASNPKDEMFVVNFNDRVRLGLPPGLPFTDDRVKLRDALLSNPVQGRTAMNDAIKVALDQLQKGRQQKKTLIVISDGGDNASELTTPALYRLVEESRVTIYTIGIYDPEDKDKNPGVLRKLSALTGGEAFMPEHLTDLVGVCTRIAKDIRNRYALGYRPSEVQADAKPHSIRVTAAAPDRGKLVVKTRTHYIAAPIPGAAQQQTRLTKPGSNVPEKAAEKQPE
jgi:Ca-activated chloride channel family protein